MSGFPYEVPPDLLAAIGSSRFVVLATHENPDADGLGSVLALGLALARGGRTVRRLENGPIPANLSGLPGLDRVPAWEGAGDELPDLVLLFDCHRRSRLGDARVHLDGASFVAAIDHHPLDPRGSDVDCLWLVEDAPSSTMLVHSLILAAELPELDAAQASNLYAGLLTDTGGFRHGNTTEDALRAAADLVRDGADAAALAESLLHGRRPQAVRLTGEVLAGTSFLHEGRIAVMVVDRALLARTGARFDESESLASQLTGIEGVRFGVLMREVGPGAWRVSLRANGEAAVDGVARSFGGGGHRAAAAFTAEGSREAVRSQVVAALSRALEGPGGSSGRGAGDRA